MPAKSIMIITSTMTYIYIRYAQNTHHVNYVHKAQSIQRVKYLHNAHQALHTQHAHQVLHIKLILNIHYVHRGEKVQFSHVHYVHTSKEHWESVRRRILLLPLDSPALPLPASWVSMSVAIVSEPPSQCQYPWSTRVTLRASQVTMCLLQDIFLHICEALWVVVGVMNCNFMILLPLLQLLWFCALKPMGSSYTSKPNKTICDSFWHLSYAVCGYHTMSIIRQTSTHLFKQRLRFFDQLLLAVLLCATNSLSVREMKSHWQKSDRREVWTEDYTGGWSQG